MATAVPQNQLCFPTVVASRAAGSIAVFAYLPLLGFDLVVSHC
jgi:hypothetical protein